MKLIIFFLLYFFATARSSGQMTQYISFGTDLSIPIKNLGKNTPPGFGGSVEYHLFLKSPVGMLAHAGFDRFKTGSGGVLNFIWLRGDLICYFYKNVLFLNAGVGISHHYLQTIRSKQTGLSLDAGVGYRKPLSEKQFIQISGFFNLHNFRKKEFNQDFDYTWLNIRAAYGFSFGKKNVKKVD